MECRHCGSDRILSISAKCSDMCSLNYKGVEHNDYPPSDLNIGGGDYIELDICFACGIAQGMNNEPDPDFYTDHHEQESDDSDADRSENFFHIKEG